MAANRKPEEVRQHNFFPNIQFDNLDDQRFVFHLNECVGRLRPVENCIVGLIYEAVKREIHLACDCRTGREYFNRMGVSKALYEVGMAIGKHVDELPLIKFYFMNGQIEYTKLRVVCRFIKKDDQEVWLQRLWNMTRKQLEELLIRLGYKSPPKPSGNFDLATLRILKYQQAQFHRLFEEANKEDPTITTHSVFLGKLLNCWRKATGKERKAAKGRTDSFQLILYKNDKTGKVSESLDSDSAEVDTSTVKELGTPDEIVKIEELQRRALKASLSQIQRAFQKAGGKWAKMEIPREIPKDIKVYVAALSAGCCAVKGCNRKIKKYHHIDRWVFWGLHIPSRIVGLCDLHSDMIHSGLLSEEELELPIPIDLNKAARADKQYQDMRDKARQKKKEHKRSSNKNSSPGSGAGVSAGLDDVA